MNTKDLIIGNHIIKNGLLFAPIAGYSDAGMRVLCREYGAGLCFTEMVSAKGLYYNSKASRDLLFTYPEEDIKAVQIFGGEPDFIAWAVKSDELKPFDIIDINMGCPVPKIVKNFEGSYLMTDPDLICKIVRAAVDASEGRPITVKLRAGFTDNYKNAVECALAAESGGASAVTVHGRTRDMFYSGHADLDIIREVKAALKIPVIGNGDVVDRTAYLKMKEYTGVDGVMVARGALGRPYIFSEILELPYEFDRIEAIKRHIMLLSHLPERVAVNNMKKQIVYYVRGLKNHRQIKEAAFKAASMDELISAIDS